ncbi:MULTISPECIES: hypothetical protein [Streptomyces]|uniref:hypothetical protein n=1 Tax=Streptomyces TaxID=1883 RepID=UPI0004CD7589|nr:hypothetical protein [Streptomyces durhamensis]
MSDEAGAPHLETRNLDPGLTGATGQTLTATGETFQPGLLNDLMARRAEPEADQIPLVPTAPEEPGEVLQGAHGGYFVPVATLPARSKRSRTPAVFLEADDLGRWSLLVWIDLVRPDTAPADARPMPLSDLTALLTTTDEQSTVTFASVTDLPAPDPHVVRRLALAAEVDPAVAADTLQNDMNAAIVVNGTLSYRVWNAETLTGEVLPDLAPEEEDQLEVASTAMLLGPGGGGIAAYLPTSDKPNRPIYYHWNFKSGADADQGLDPDNVWVDSPAGLWQMSPLPNQYFVLPSEYRLAFDLERGTPAMSVLLVRPDAAADAAAGPDQAWKIRVRFKLVPWLEPQSMERLRAAVADVEGIAYPQLVLGGYAGATFDESSWLKDLGGRTLSTEAGNTTIDARGFELVQDCSMEYYTLLARLLAPASGTATGIEGRVVLSLRRSPDDDTAKEQRDVPVRIRLDQPDDGFLTTEQITAPFPDAASWPAGWTPPFYAKVRSPSAVRADVSGVVAALLVNDPLTGVPVDRARAAATPASFSLGGPDAAPVQPPAEAAPATPAGAPAFQPPANPPVGNGEVLLRLTQTEAEPVDPRLVSSLALDYTGVTVKIDPAVMLERVHELGTSTGLVAHVNVSSYQLKHPETLPPELADVFGIDVEMRRGSAEAVTVSLTRDAPEATSDIPFGFSDLVADLHPDQPKFEYRRRNVATKGTGPFSPWESVVGRNLLVTPVT